MHRTLPQFLIYAVCHIAIALWRAIPPTLIAAGIILLLALCEHGTNLLQHITTR